MIGSYLESTAVITSFHVLTFSFVVIIKNKIMRSDNSFQSLQRYVTASKVGCTRAKEPSGFLRLLC